MRNSNITYTSRRRQNPTSSRSYGRNANITIFEPTKKLGMISRILMFAGFFVLLGLIYLGNATRSTAYGTQIQAQDSENADLQVKIGDLEVENARLTSLGSIANSDVAKAMTTTSTVNYAE